MAALGRSNAKKLRLSLASAITSGVPSSTSLMAFVRSR